MDSFIKIGNNEKFVFLDQFFTKNYGNQIKEKT